MAIEKISQQIAEELQQSYVELWQTLALLNESELVDPCLPDGWSPQAVLAHVAFWDDYQTRRMQAAYAGQSVQHGFARPALDNDERARLDLAREWNDIAAEADAARRRMVEFAANLPVVALQMKYPEGERTLSLARLLQHMIEHTRQHRRDVYRYCGSMRRWKRPALRRFIVEQHDNLMNSIAGLTEATMLRDRVCGEWTIRDTLAHVLARNEAGEHLVRHWTNLQTGDSRAGASGDAETPDALNARLLAAKAELDLIAIADGLTTCYRRMMRHFDAFDDADFVGEGQSWDGISDLSCFFYDIFVHEARHAEQIWAYRAGEMSEM